jgi:hypothetical protein
MHAAATQLEIANFLVTASSVVVTLIIGILTVRVRRRCLIYSYRLVRRLNGLTVAGVLTPSGTVGPVTDPYQVEIVFVNRSGPQGISSSDFNGNDPIRVDFAVPIWSVSDKTYPTVQSSPTRSYSGSELSVGPSNMADGQVTTFSVWVDGKPPRKVRVASPFHTIRFKRSAFRIPGSQLTRATWAIVGFILTAAIPPSVGVALAWTTRQPLTIPMSGVFAACGLISGAIFAIARR